MSSKDNVKDNRLLPVRGECAEDETDDLILSVIAEILRVMYSIFVGVANAGLAFCRAIYTELRHENVEKPE